MNRANVIGPVARSRRGSPPSRTGSDGDVERPRPASRLRSIGGLAPRRAGAPGPTRLWPPRTIGIGASRADGRQRPEPRVGDPLGAAAGRSRSDPRRPASRARRRRSDGRGGRGVSTRAASPSSASDRAERRRARRDRGAGPRLERVGRWPARPRPEPALLDEGPRPRRGRALQPGETRRGGPARRRASSQRGSRLTRRRRRERARTTPIVDADSAARVARPPPARRAGRRAASRDRPASRQRRRRSSTA